MKNIFLLVLTLFLVSSCSSQESEVKDTGPSDLEVQGNMTAILVDSLQKSWGMTVTVDDVNYDNMKTNHENDLYCQYSTLDAIDANGIGMSDVQYDICGVFLNNSFHIAYFTFNNEVYLDEVTGYIDDEGNITRAYVELKNGK